jgi:hypothetical protein
VSERTELLLKIARCPIVEKCLADPSPTHPCSKIVLYQWPDDVPFEQRLERWRSEHHIPEPWVGHLESAPLLFLSSNPSIAPSGRHKPGSPPAPAPPLQRLGEHTADDHPSLRRGLSAPKWDWDDDQIVDRVSSAFDVFMNKEGTANLLASGEPDRVVPYWRDIRELADHLHGRETRPGVDYALTEAVRCKSPKEIGVPDAAKECVPRYLRRTLALSPARVICVVGRPARMAIRGTYSYPNAPQVSAPIEIEGRERLIVFVSAPSAYEGRLAYSKTVPDEAVGAVRQWLRS